VTPERRHLLEQLARRVVEHEPARRDEVMDLVCGSDTELRRDLVPVVAAYEAAEDAEETTRLPLPDLDPKPEAPRFAFFELGSKIGKGGMGEVYLARDTRLGRPVALKLLPTALTEDRERVRRFHQEARLASALNHPNICTIYELGRDDSGVHFIAMELVEGTTLRAMLGDGPLPVDRVLSIGAQVAEALAVAHRAGVIHRDLKPENIMVRRDGYVKILDFGLAKLLTPRPGEESGLVDTEVGVVLGTVRYMSPEQAQAQAVDARTDVWSLGVLLYELLSGRLPFEGKSPFDMFVAIIGTEPPDLATLVPGASPELEAVVKRALRKRVEDRYASAAELAADLQKLKGHLAHASPSSDAATAEHRAAVRAASPPTNLPAPSAKLIGRDREVDELTALLRREDLRLVTLTGAGGTGKTSLARHVAHELLAEYADGVFLVDLATLTDPELVVYTVAQALGVKEAGGGTIGDALKEFLREKRTLLVFDNFEHVAAAAPLVAELCAAAPHVKALVTSRVVLHLSAEHEYVVSPLELPSTAARARQVPLGELQRCAAVALFVDRAAAARPGFALTAENAMAVAEICTRLDGLPLALELAAARVKLLQPQAILARLENRLKLLTGGARDLPSRQQTMRGAISWSYDLLDEAEKTLLQRLSVFAGGCTLEAAEAICDAGGDLGIDVLDGLASLADKSLVTQRAQGDDEPRFRMLELVREFARESLGESGEAELMAHRHERYFLETAEQADAEQRALYSAKAPERFEREHDNLRAALAHALETNAENALRLAGALSPFWMMRGYLLEGRRWCERALEASGSAAPTAAKGRALHGAGELIWRLGDLHAARAFYEESVRIARQVGDKKLIADASSGLGVVQMLRGDAAAARAHFEEALALAREAGNAPLAGKALNNLGELARANGDAETARRCYEEALAENAAAPSPDERLTSFANFNLGEMALEAGDCPAARRYFFASLAAGREAGFSIGIHAALEGFSILAAAEGRMREAALLFGVTDALQSELGITAEPNDEKVQVPLRAAARAALGDAAFDAALLEGQGMRLEEAIALAEDDSAAG
jgi:non-specific serine/threonine protein kinase